MTPSIRQFFLGFLLCIGVPLTYALEQSPSSRIEAPQSKTSSLPKTLRLGVTKSGWMPFIGKGEESPLQGISGTVIDDFSRSAGVDITLVPYNNFEQLLAALESKEVDFISDVFATPQRTKQFRFTQTYLNIHEGIITHTESSPLFSLEELANKKVVVERGFYRADQLTEQHPDIRLLPVSSTEDALRQVSEGSADAYVGNLEVANYLIGSQLIPNLHVTTALQTEVKGLAFAVRQDLPALEQALNHFIEAGEKLHYFDQLRVKWTSHSYNSVNSYRTLVTHTGYAALGLSAALLLIFYWVFRIRRALRQRDRAWQKLAEKQADFQLILDNINQGVIRSDAKRRICFLNQPSYIDFNLKPDQIDQLDLYSLAELQLPEIALPKQQRQQLHQAISDNQPFQLKLKGAKKTLDLQYQPLPDGGSLITYSDISEQVAHEQALYEARLTAEQAAHTKAHFLANMSHEIRTPMNGILGMLELLEHGDLKLEQRRNLTEIRQSAEALLVIINDILDFSKLDEGEMRLNPQPANLTCSLERVCGNLGILAGKKGLKFYLDIQPEIASQLVFDAVRIEQILTNLIGNAIKFTLNGFILVQVKLVKVLGTLQLIEFSVQDSGVGIEEDDLKRLFTPFQQADAGTNRQFGGTGLGLSICKKLAQAMDARIELKSQPGQGTRADFCLPLEVAQTDCLPTRPLSGVHFNLCCTEQMVSESVEHQLRHLGASIRRLTPEDLPHILRQEEKDSICILNNPVWCRNEVREFLTERALPVINLITEPYLNSLDTCENYFEISGNPLFSTQLITVIDQILGRDPVLPEDPNQPLPRKSAKNIDQAEQDHELILLVEDHATNRLVLLQQLNLLGYTAEVVCNGREGLNAWKSGRFQMIVTDCHMPQLDGYDMTRAIRMAEPTGTRIPVIALTASVLEGEKEKCLAAGMDDYITKPANLDSLRSMLNRWFPLATGKPSMDAESPTTPCTGPIATETLSDNKHAFDCTHLSEFFEPKALNALLRDYSRSTQKDWQALLGAYSARKLEQVKYFAHRIKGASRTIYAEAVAETAEKVEYAARDEQWSEVERLQDELKQRLTSLLERLDEKVA